MGLELTEFDTSSIPGINEASLIYDKMLDQLNRSAKSLLYKIALILYPDVNPDFVVKAIELKWDERYNRNNVYLGNTLLGHISLSHSNSVVDGKASSEFIFQPVLSELSNT